MRNKVLILGLVLVLTVSTSLGLLPWDQVEDIIGAKIGLQDRLEAITKKSYTFTENARWEEIKATGLILTEKSWEAFAQICERLVFELWDFKIYIDLEARVMWTYADSSNPESEIYYVQFTD